MKNLLFLLALLPLAAFSQSNIDHWESVVTENFSWKYRAPSATVPGWNTVGFNDFSWFNGQASIGYGDGDDNTIVANGTVTVYMRATFTITDTSKIEEAVLHMDYDDAFVAYLNGTEIARANIGTAGIQPGFNDFSTGLHEAVMYTGGTPEIFSVPKSMIAALMVNGTNVLAIEVHNESAGSSDLTAFGFFSLAINDTSSDYSPTPSWFVAPVNLQSSNLPVVIINTNSQTIVDDPRIVCDMGIIDNGPGIRNYVTDPFNNYNGKISIEIRGSSSQMFPKKSYALETQDIGGNQLNVSLMGMPAENDWILYAPYTDKSLMRDVLAYKMGSEQGYWAPRTRFCELIINNEYMGVYVMLEKIKIDNNRLDLAKLKPADTTGDELTGGYLLKVDRYDTPTDHFTSSFLTVPNNTQINYVYDDPEDPELLPVQEAYIQDFIYDFEYAAVLPSFADTNVGYRKFADINSFIDHYLLNEVSRNVDGYRLSAFVHKDKESNGGKLKAGPLWDYNLGYGNANYCNGSVISGYALDFNTDCPGDGWQIPFWWYRMTSDTNFQNMAKCRYNYLRATVFSTSYLMNYIDSVALVLDESQIRNFQKWPVLGTWVWPNDFVGSTYQEEINYMKIWISSRLNWLDTNLPGTCTSVSVNETAAEFFFTLYPNPAEENVMLFSGTISDFTLQISDITGKIISETKLSGRKNQINVSGLSSGMYIFTCMQEGASPRSVKFVKR